MRDTWNKRKTKFALTCNDQKVGRSHLEVVKNSTIHFFSKLLVFKNYSPKAKWMLSNNPRDEVEGIIWQYSLSLREIIVLVQSQNRTTEIYDSNCLASILESNTSSWKDFWSKGDSHFENYPSFQISWICRDIFQINEKFIHNYPPCLLAKMAKVASSVANPLKCYISSLERFI